LDDSFNLARYDYLNFSTALNLLKYLRRETELIPLAAGFKAIEFLIESMDQQTFFEDLRDILVNIVDEIYVRINNSSFSTASDDEEYHVLTKLHVNLFACKIGAKSCLKDATRKLFLFDFEIKQLDVNDRPILYCGILGDDLASFNWIQLKTKILKANGNEQFYRDNQDEFNEIFHAFSGEIF
jgi:ERAP1-like C-terminal domain